MKKNKISKEWIKRQRRDIYVKKSKQEGFRSRAVYKLQEINDKHKIIKNQLVVELKKALETLTLEWTGKYVPYKDQKRIPKR